MGTNYYLRQKPACECCGREFDIEATRNAAGVQWRRLENGDYEVS